MSDPNLPPGVTQADVERAEPEVCEMCDDPLTGGGVCCHCAMEQNSED